VEVVGEVGGAELRMARETKEIRSHRRLKMGRGHTLKCYRVMSGMIGQPIFLPVTIENTEYSNFVAVETSADNRDSTLL
jgi:hypothetical protein